MDKDILNSLNNTAQALELLVQQLKLKNKENVDISKMSSNTVEHILEIKASIEEIKSDNKKILDNQKTLIETVKRQEQKKNVFSAMAGDGENKGFVDSLKTGVSNILLIAGGILAIGAAFLLIGKVDFMSVIALGITLPLIAFAFSQMGTMEKLKDPGTMRNVATSLLIISAVIVASSYILNATSVVTPMKLITAVGIAGIMYIMSKGIANIGDDIKNIDLRTLAAVPLVMVTSAMAIALSSHILQMVAPVAPVQLITTIGIAGTMYLMGMGVSKIANSVKGINIAGLLLLPFIMVTTSMAIALSSHILQTVAPISLMQLLTAGAISGIFVIMSYSIAKASKSMGDIRNAATVAVMLPIAMIAMSFAVAGSSHILSGTQVVSFPQLLTAVGISIAFIGMAYAINAMNLDKIKWGDVGKLPVLLITMSAAILGASFFLNKIQPVPEEKLWNFVLMTAAISVSAVVFGASIWAISKLKLGLKEIVTGGLSVLAIATVITVSSHILAAGNYEKYPSLDWSKGTGLSLLVFGLSTLALGLAIGLTGGAGAVALAAGAVATLALAAVITGSSIILSKGTYTGGPSVDWSKATGLSLFVFGAATVALGTLIVGTLGLGMVALAAGSKAILDISRTIVDSSAILSRGRYTGGPTYEWARGVSLALGAFSSVYKIMLADSILSKFGMGVSISKFNDAIIAISKGILTSSIYLSTGNFTGGPTYEWARGVSLAIGAFSPVYARIGNSGILGFLSGNSGSVEDMNNAIIAICESIVTAAHFFNNNSIAFNENGAPSEAWARNVGNAIKAFVPVFDFISNNDGIFKSNAIKKMQDSISGVLTSLVSSSAILSMGRWNTVIPDSYVDSMTKAIKSYINMEKELDDSGTAGTFFKRSNISKVSTDIVSLSRGIDKLSTSLGRLNNSIDMEKLNALKTVNGTFVLMSLMDSDSFNNVLNAIESKSGVYSKLLEDLRDDTKNNVSNNSVVRLPQQMVQQSNNNDEIYNVLVSIDRKLGTISDEVSSLSDFVTSIQSRNRIK